MNSATTRRGVCLVVAAPSGAGKSTITRALLDSEPGVSLSISATTRAPRSGERDGEHYHFRSPAAFDAMVQAGELLEWAEVFGLRYGTPRTPVERALSAGRDIVFDIDWQGYRTMRAALPGDVLGVFILPPSMGALQARLVRRGDAEDNVQRRMQTARDEIAHWPEFDYVIVNDDLDRAIDAVRSVLHAARCATGRQPGLSGVVAALQ